MSDDVPSVVEVQEEGRARSVRRGRGDELEEELHWFEALLSNALNVGFQRIFNVALGGEVVEQGGVLDRVSQQSGSWNERRASYGRGIREDRLWSRERIGQACTVAKLSGGGERPQGRPG